MKRILCWIFGHRWAYKHVLEVTPNGAWLGNHGPCVRCEEKASSTTRWRYKRGDHICSLPANLYDSERE